MTGVTMNLEKSLHVVQKHFHVKFSMDGGVTLGIIPTMIDEVFVRAFLWEERQVVSSQVVSPSVTGLLVHARL
jgi:hypothetical protein